MVKKTRPQIETGFFLLKTFLQKTHFRTIYSIDIFPNTQLTFCLPDHQPFAGKTPDHPTSNTLNVYPTTLVSGYS